MSARLSIVLLALVAAASGCAATGQQYREVTYSEPDDAGDAYVTSEVTVRNRTVAPPFGAKSISEHAFDTTVSDSGGYEIHMGSRGDLEGGDLASAIREFSQAVRDMTRLWMELKSPVPLEPLTD